jgi:hypothetical protein
VALRDVGNLVRKNRCELLIVLHRIIKTARDENISARRGKSIDRIGIQNAESKIELRTRAVVAQRFADHDDATGHGFVLREPAIARHNIDCHRAADFQFIRKRNTGGAFNHVGNTIDRHIARTRRRGWCMGRKRIGNARDTELGPDKAAGTKKECRREGNQGAFHWPPPYSPK